MAENIGGDLLEDLDTDILSDIEEYKKQFYDFRSEGAKRKPVVDTMKMEVQGPKDSGRTTFIARSWELHPKNPIFRKPTSRKPNPKYDKRYDHVKYLLDKGFLKAAAPVWALDGDGKFKLMDREGLFHGKPILYKDLWHPNSKFPTMQDAIAWVSEVSKFLKMLYTFDEGIGALEDSSFLTTQIQTYVQYWLRERPVHADLPLGHLPEYGYEDWGIRNSIWDYIGGMIQRCPIHFILTTKVGDKWEGGGPTDKQEAKRYKNTPHFFNVIVRLWSVENDGQLKFFGKIWSSDFTPAGQAFPTIEDPSFLKIVAILCKHSHVEQLQAFYEETGTGPDDYYSGLEEAEA